MAGTEIILSPAPELQPAPLFTPTPKAARRVLEFFTAQVNNDHTRKAFRYALRVWSLLTCAARSGILHRPGQQRPHAQGVPERDPSLRGMVRRERHRPARRRAGLPRRRLREGAARRIDRK